MHVAWTVSHSSQQPDTPGSGVTITVEGWTLSGVVACGGRSATLRSLRLIKTFVSVWWGVVLFGRKGGKQRILHVLHLEFSPTGVATIGRLLAMPSRIAIGSPSCRDAETMISSEAYTEGMSSRRPSIATLWRSFRLSISDSNLSRSGPSPTTTNFVEGSSAKTWVAACRNISTPFSTESLPIRPTIGG